MTVSHKVSPPSENTSDAPALRGVALGAATGTFCGGLVGAALIGYMQLLQEISGSPDAGTLWVFKAMCVVLAAIIGGIGGAIAGSAVGLIAGLILVGRNNSGKAVRLR
jgi:hypothetical protein